MGTLELLPSPDRTNGHTIVSPPWRELRLSVLSPHPCWRAPQNCQNRRFDRAGDGDLAQAMPIRHDKGMFLATRSRVRAERSAD